VSTNVLTGVKNKLLFPVPELIST